MKVGDQFESPFQSKKCKYQINGSVKSDKITLEKRTFDNTFQNDKLVLRIS